MRDKEEKLTILLQIAVKNGWNEGTLSMFIYTPSKITFEVINNKLYITENKDVLHYSLNDLVTNFEPDEVSFIEALLLSTETISNSCFDDKILKLIKLNIFSLKDICVFQWDYKPTSQRLNWLFETFNHLLIES